MASEYDHDPSDRGADLYNSTIRPLDQGKHESFLRFIEENTIS